MNDGQVIRSCCDYIEKHLQMEICMEELAAYHGYSFRQLERIFREVMGISISEYIRKRKVDVGLYMILHGDSVEDTAKSLGYSGAYTFARAVSGEYGDSPSRFVKKLMQPQAEQVNLEGIEIKKKKAFTIYYRDTKKESGENTFVFEESAQIGYWKWGHAEKGVMDGFVGYLDKSRIPEEERMEKIIESSWYVIFPVTFEIALEKVVNSLSFHNFWRLLAESWLLKSHYTMDWMGTPFVFCAGEGLIKQRKYCENAYLYIPIKQRK